MRYFDSNQKIEDIKRDFCTLLTCQMDFANY